MRTQWLSLLRGYATIQVRGSRLDAFLNAATENRLVIWDVFIKDERVLQLSLSLRDFFRLRPLLRKTSCRLHIVGRSGLPFFLQKLSSRKIFVSGIFGFVIGLYVLSSLIWSIQVEGNDKLSADTILEAARKEGIHPFQWKFRLRSMDELSRSLHSQLPGSAWVGVEIKGTQVRIQVVESTVPEEQPLLNPRHLVAAKNALITEVRAEKGKPLVSTNMYVRKGDVLISGLIGDEVHQQIVVAKGIVRGLVWYTATAEVPQKIVYKSYTGEEQKKFYLIFGERALKITGYKQPRYNQSETLTDRKSLHWRKFSLPFGWMTERVKESDLTEQNLSEQDAVMLGMERAKTEVLLDAGKNPKVTREKILHQKAENGKVYIEVYIEVEEDIMIEQPIIQGD